MNKVCMFAAAIAAVLTFAGCDNTPVGWFKTSGGYINLREVHNIASEAEVCIGETTVLSGEISAENIKHVRSLLKDCPKTAQIQLSASIEFDNYTLELAGGKNLKPQDALDIVEAWEEVMEQLAVQLP